jgi:two-component system chemotaxis sensor kinase CheA
MSLDPEMMEIAKVFFDECREGLDIMESGLLNLDAGADRENINTIFRAAHSIKGGAATFGFLEVSSFTHGVETLLDEMRNGKREVTTEAVQILLQSCDCLREMMSATDSGRPLDQVRIAALNMEISDILAAGAASAPLQAAPAPAAAAAAAVAYAEAPQTPLPAAERPGSSGWRIRFEPVAGLLKLRNEPTRMFAEIEKLGEFTVRADLSALPAFGEFDPELCHLAWDLEILGTVSRQKLDEIFDWVDPACGLEFTPVVGAQAKASAPNPDTAGVAVPAGAPAALVAPAVPASGGAPAARAAPAETAPIPQAQVPAAAPAAAAPKAAAESGSIRVATEKVDNIINLVGELVITQSMLGRFAEGADPAELESLRQGLLQLARNTRELQESVMQVRMLPISFAFNRFPRLVHDLTRKLGKKVDLRLTGEGTELDKTVLEKISDPLVHLVRNALDHGLETPETRLAAGKSETGTLELSAFHEGGSIIIEVRDDGAGLNRTKILSKARERGLVAGDQELTDEQVQNLIFMPGFSTADQISDVSGRGVGMDVVRRNINDLGGHVQINSQQGKGSVIRIRLPLTLAILDGQLVRVGSETYVISLLAIVETIQVSRERLNTVAGRAELFRLREEYLPVVKLCDLFGVEPDSHSTEDGLLVVVEADGTRVGLLVDDLLAQQQVVIKSLETNFKQVVGLAGATILGDGKVALIIDAPGLIDRASRMHRDASKVRAA